MDSGADQSELYKEAGSKFAPAIARLALAVEFDRDRSRDLEQEIHAAIWQSLARFDGRCSLKTWVFRVAHNVAADHVAAQMRRPALVTLDAIDDLPALHDPERQLAEQHALGRIRALLPTLQPLDRQVILLWLEGQSGTEIAEIAGLSTNAVQVRIHRIKALIARAFDTPSEGNH